VSDEAKQGNIPEDIRFSLEYLKSGGLAEVLWFTESAYRARQPKVQSDTDLVMALIILAQRGIDAEPTP